MKIKFSYIVEIIRKNYFYIDKRGVGRQTPLDKYAKDVTKEILMYLKGGKDESTFSKNRKFTR